MSDSLVTYLQDHLAGSTHATELVGTMRDNFRGEPLGEFAASLLTDIEADVDVLREIVKRIGASSSALKEMSAWVGEKMMRMKLSREKENTLGTLEALEWLELGIHGKWAMWKALAAIAGSEPGLAGFDFVALAERAQEQRDRVEARRVQIARIALRA